ncbi:MAG: 3-dehydroquinate synthase, partial [Gemmataceae bacterium]
IIREGIQEIGSPVLILVDPKVAWLGQEIFQHLGSRPVKTALETVAVSEDRKNLETVEAVYELMARHGVTRDTIIIVVGGGVLTDLAGYAAATYLRGLDWIAVPTSLLGQVDAALGGKVAVNTAWGKNLIGAFHLPQKVLVDVACLRTLPVAEWRAGVGEVIKSALIAGGRLWDELVNQLPPMGQVDGRWLSLIAQTAEIKIDVVNQDLYEQGPRMHLNFGHTVGHGLENLLGYGVLKHGEAVGLGSLVALRLSERIVGLDPMVREEVKRWLGAWGLPTQLPGVSYAALAPVLERDKKARAFGLQWILIEKVGKPTIVRGIDPGLVAQALAELNEGSVPMV